MRILLEPPLPGAPPDLLLALLTGSLSQPEDFLREGFVAAARERGVGAEIALVGTPAARVADGTIAQSLEDFFAAPARARGRTRLWLAGISLGGLAAMAHALRHPAPIAGIVLLAPYPGSRDWLRRLDALGGLPALSGEPPQDPPDAERDAWTWLATWGGLATPPTHLLYGADDRFAEGQARIARALRPERVMRVAGAHDWPAWRQAWNLFLDTNGEVLGAPETRAAPAPERQGAR